MTSTGTSTRRVISRTAVKVSRSRKPPASAACVASWMIGAVHHRIGVRRAELEDVGAVLGEGDGRVDARLQVGEAERQVADERAAALGVGGVDRGGDARGHSFVPSPLAASSAGGDGRSTAAASYSSK